MRWENNMEFYSYLTRISSVRVYIIYRNNTLRPRQNGRCFTDDTFKRIFLNENVRILIKISLKFVPKGLINNISTLVQIMAWRRSGDKPLSEPMMVSLLTHICVTRPQWVNKCMTNVKFKKIKPYLDPMSSNFLPIASVFGIKNGVL